MGIVWVAYQKGGLMSLGVPENITDLLRWAGVGTTHLQSPTTHVPCSAVPALEQRGKKHTRTIAATIGTSRLPKFKQNYTPWEFTSSEPIPFEIILKNTDLAFVNPYKYVVTKRTRVNWLTVHFLFAPYTVYLNYIYNRLIQLIHKCRYMYDEWIPYILEYIKVYHSLCFFPADPRLRVFQVAPRQIPFIQVNPLPRFGFEGDFLRDFLSRHWPRSSYAF